MNRIYQGMVTNDAETPVRFGRDIWFNWHLALFEKRKGAAKAPYGSHRFNLSAGAARLFPTYRGRATGFDPHCW